MTGCARQRGRRAEDAYRGAGGRRFQRHRANYALAASSLGPGPVLDLGCGVGHSVDLLAERKSVGLDSEPGALAGPRETVVADMRAIPFGRGAFASVVCSHALEHVPDPERVLAEAGRVLAPGGVAVFTTPNRLTFGRPDEIIDPYHYLEWSPAELETLCRRVFEAVEVHGVFGSERYLRVVALEREKLDALLRMDPLRLRRVLPRRLRQLLYDRRLRRERRAAGSDAAAIAVTDFELRREGLDEAIDLLAVCRHPRAVPSA